MKFVFIQMVLWAVCVLSLVALADHAIAKITFDVAAKLRPDTANAMIITGDWEK